MEYFLGLLSGVVFLSAMGAAVYVGYRLGRKKPPAQKVDEEEKQRMESYDKHFKALFSYDVSKALQRKKVTNDE